MHCTLLFCDILITSCICGGYIKNSLPKTVGICAISSAIFATFSRLGGTKDAVHLCHCYFPAIRNLNHCFFPPHSLALDLAQLHANTVKSTYSSSTTDMLCPARTVPAENRRLSDVGYMGLLVSLLRIHIQCL